MATMLLIRHATNDYVHNSRLAGRLPGVHLNDEGRAQAQGLGERLASAAIRAVYSSPLERALETAAPIAEARGLEVVPRAGLIESDCGTWQGKSLKGLSRLKLWRVLRNSPAIARFPDGESIAEVQYRICREIDNLCHQHDPHELIVCVSHSDPIKLAVAFFIGLPLDLYHRLRVDPASITALHLGEAGSYLVTLNSHALPSLPQQKL